MPLLDCSFGPPKNFGMVPLVGLSGGHLDLINIFCKRKLPEIGNLVERIGLNRPTARQGNTGCRVEYHDKYWRV